MWDAESAAEYDETLVKASFATPPAPKLDVGAGGGWRPDEAERLRAAFAPAGRPSAAKLVTTGQGAYLFETLLLEGREGDQTMEYSGGLAGLSPSLALSDAAILARYLFADEHLARMAASAAVLGLPFDVEAARGVLIGLARVTPDVTVVRIELDAAANFSLSCRDLPGQVGAGGGQAAPAGSDGAGDSQGGAAACGGAQAHGDFAPVTLLLSPFRTDPDDPFLRHKTSVRGFYNREHRRALHEGHFDALFVNRLDHVTEGAITNIFARFGEEWVTPPLTDGLLPGIWRAWFLAEKAPDERSLTLEELLGADEILVGNSVRGAVRVSGLVADPLAF